MQENTHHRRSTQAPTATIPPFGLRMQSVLKGELEAAAEASGRSLNAEIVDRLRQSFEPMFELESESLTLLDGYAQTHGITAKEALAILILAGSKEADAKIVYLQMNQGVSLAEFSKQIQSAAQENPGAVVHLAKSNQERRTVGAEIHAITGGVVRVAQRISMA